jgi:hypothetical protein
MYFCLIVSATVFLPHSFLCSFVCFDPTSDGCYRGAAEIKPRDVNIVARLLFIQVSWKSKPYVCSNCDGGEIDNEQNDGDLQVCTGVPGRNIFNDRRASSKVNRWRSLLIVIVQVLLQHSLQL